MAPLSSLHWTGLTSLPHDLRFRGSRSFITSASHHLLLGMFVRERSDTVEQDIDLLKEPWTPNADTKPDVIPPKGLNPDRHWYVYEQIRPFCPPNDQDTTCPRPTVPRPGGSKHGTPHPEELPNPPATPPPPKRQRICGIYHTGP